MPIKKSGQRKKAEKQRERQKMIQKGRISGMELHDHPCNAEMECRDCGKFQKNRSFCYFCGSLPKNPQCGQCGKIKCVPGASDCLVKHTGVNAVGIGMVGAVCDFCETWICHSKRCIQSHACSCPLRFEDEPVSCIECERTAWEHGGKMFICNTCELWLCSDDFLEHQASCQHLEGEDFKCISCNKFGSYICMRCKVGFCDDHQGSFMNKVTGQESCCKKCGFRLRETKDLSISTKNHDYGRNENEGWEDDYEDDID